MRRRRLLRRGPIVVAALALAAVAACTPVMRAAAADTTSAGPSAATGPPCPKLNASVPDSPAGATLAAVSPQVTDPQLGARSGGGYGTEPSADHCYGRPVGAANGYLYLFLPGAGALASNYQEIVENAQAHGFFAISLSWPNGAAATSDLAAREVARICGADLGCYGQVRANRYDGSVDTTCDSATGRTDAGAPCTPTTAFPHDDPYAVAPTYGPNRACGAVNSVKYRLCALLDWLTANDPQGDGGSWQQFRNPDGTPDFARIVLGGHSQGSAQAAYIAGVTPVVGVTLYSGPDDTPSLALDRQPYTCAAPPSTAQRQPVATWETQPFATPISRFSGLTGCDDAIAFLQTVSSWSQLGGGLGAPLTATNPGSFTPIEQLTAPYGGQRALFTSLRGTSAVVPGHDVSAFDADTPLCPDGRTPRLAQAWTQMLDWAIGSDAVAPPVC